MTDPNQRRMNWQIKTDTTKVKQILDDRRPDMLKRYEAAVASLCEMEVKARQTLNAAGVHTIFYVAYLNDGGGGGVQKLLHDLTTQATSR